MRKSTLRYKSVLFALAIGLVFSSLGCQAIKRVFTKPPPEGVVQSSYPISVAGYDWELVVKATPEELVNHIFKDFSWVEKKLDKIPMIKVDVKDVSGIDMSKLGQSIFFKISILGIVFPARLTTLRYEPNKEMWLLATSRGNWVLLRLKIKSIPEGCKLHVNMLINPSSAFRKITDPPTFAKLIAQPVDSFLALMQAEFDPELDVDEMTQEGIRGENYEGFLQAYEAQLWVDASPKEIESWLLNPENLRRFMHEFNVEEQYFIEYQQLDEGRVLYSPAAFKSGIFKVKMETFTVRTKEDKTSNTRIYLIAINQFAFVELQTMPERGGSLLTMRSVGEIPGGLSSGTMDLMIFASNIPKILQEKLIMIKKETENKGEILNDE